MKLLPWHRDSGEIPSIRILHRTQVITKASPWRAAWNKTGSHTRFAWAIICWHFCLQNGVQYTSLHVRQLYLSTGRDFSRMQTVSSVAKLQRLWAACRLLNWALKRPPCIVITDSAMERRLVQHDNASLSMLDCSSSRRWQVTKGPQYPISALFCPSLLLSLKQASAFKSVHELLSPRAPFMSRTWCLLGSC